MTLIGTARRRDAGRLVGLVLALAVALVLFTPRVHAMPGLLSGPSDHGAMHVGERSVNAHHGAHDPARDKGPASDAKRLAAACAAGLACCAPPPSLPSGPEPLVPASFPQPADRSGEGTLMTPDPPPPRS